MLERTGEMPGQKAKGFTTVGKPKMATKQYNSPMAMYSEDIIEEIMTQVSPFEETVQLELRSNKSLLFSCIIICIHSSAAHMLCVQTRASEGEMF